LSQGCEGEKMFDAWTEKLQCDCLILNDLLLESNNTTFQIDSLLITAKTIYFYEVKNFIGDYCFHEDKFFKLPRYEITNPLHQLSRSESLLRHLLPKNGINLPTEGLLAFV